MQPLQPNIEVKWYNISAAFNKWKNKKWIGICEKGEYKTGRANHQSLKKSSQVWAGQPS